MSKNKIIIYIVAIVILLGIPLYTVYENYDLLINGQEYSFEVEAFDPHDIFRGKYLYVNFKENKVESAKLGNEENNYYYVEIKTNKDGFSYFDNITTTKPKNIKNYYKTKGYYSKYMGSNYIIDTPTRYYMNENKSSEAEKIYEDNVEDAYVKVRVKNGNMIITGVYVNDKLIDLYK